MINRFILFSILIAAFGVINSLAQNKILRFEQYLVSNKFTGEPARVNLSSHPMARKYRTMLRSAVKEDGVNFAGGYTVAWWGCGTECQYVAIINAKNGKVFFLPFNPGYGISFRSDSNLLIVNPPEELNDRFTEDDPDRPDSIYFKWTGEKLILLYPKKPNRIIDRYSE